MEHYGKEKKIYHGFIIPYIVMIVVPIVLYFPFYYAIKHFSKFPDIIIVYMSIAFSALIGVLFEISCIISGFVHDNFLAMLARIRALFSNYKIFKKQAFKWYWDDFKETGGIIFWIFVLVFLATTTVCVYYFIRFFAWYGSL